MMLSNNLLLYMGGTLDIAGKTFGSGRDCFVATLLAVTGDKYVIAGKAKQSQNSSILDHDTAN
jgi:hypothetical protein